MVLGKSIKMYLTLFVATTCIYMVLYQYHITREAMPAELMKNKLISDETTKQAHNARISRYNLFLWSPLMLMMSQSSTTPTQAYATTTTTTTTPPPPSSTITITKPSKWNLTSLSIIKSTSQASTISLVPTISSTLSSPPSSLLSSFLLTPSQAIVPASAPVPALANTRTNHSVVRTSELDSSTDSNNTNATTTTTTANTRRAVKLANISSTVTTTTTTTVDTIFNKTFISNTNKFASKNNNNSNNNNSTAKITTSATTKTTVKKFAAAKNPPPLYIITPTYRRPEQLAELTRLGYTLKHVANLLWLVIEDANKTSPLVTSTLERIGVPYEYLVAPMPVEYKKTKKAKPRGVSNRNRGLQWLRENATDGVFYFADDDNTYDVTIFEQMRYTKKVSMWPVGLVTKFGVSSPVIRNNQIVGFYDGWIGGRKYPVDMAGFAVSVDFLLERPAAKMPFKPGYEEDGFLKSLAPLNNTEIELLASNCTEILTWHTQTKKNEQAQPLNITKYGDTNLVKINKGLVRS